MLGFPGGTSGKENTCQCRRQMRLGLDPWVRKISLEKEVATHSSILAWRIPMDRVDWAGIVHGLDKSHTQVGNWTTTRQIYNKYMLSKWINKHFINIYLYRNKDTRGHVRMWEWDSKESWALKNWCFWTVVLEKTLESPLDCKEIQTVHPKGDQSCVFIGRTDTEAETPVLWPPHEKSWLIGKDPDAGRDWGQEEKGTTEDEMAGWHHPLGVGDGQRELACCISWGCKESDTTERLNWTELKDTRL